MKNRTLVALALLAGLGTAAYADTVTCQKQVIATMLKFKKKYMKTIEKCLDNENAGKIAGPCPDAASQLKIQTTQVKIRAKLAASCAGSDLTTLGFTTCAFEATGTGIESTCGAFPVTDGGELADCLMCWKGAQMATFLATLYGSHAQELCGTALDETSPICRELDCSTPLPNQGDINGGGEYDCQRAIAKGGIKHLVSVEKIREKCGLVPGNTQASCDADLANQVAIEKSRFKMETLIKNKCGAGRDPVADPPFCCRTTGNSCVAAADRTDCTDNLGGDVMEGKSCNAGTCTGGGGGSITWWNTCPLNDSCTPSNDVTTLDELIACVDASAHESSDAMLCLQFPSGWTCPPDAP